MKKSILVILLVLIATAAAVSGCLGGDDGDADIGDAGNNTTEPPSDDSGNSSDPATVITSFNAGVVTVNPLPDGFTHLATRSVVANTRGIGISDALIGYRNMMTYDNANVYLSAYKCSLVETANDTIREMVSSHAAKYGNDSSVSTVRINGHDATLLEATVHDTPPEGRYILVWSNWSGDEFDDSYLVVINGQVNYSVIQTLAEASDL